jgi:hypothetical protein
MADSMVEVSMVGDGGVDDLSPSRRVVYAGFWCVG